MLRCSSLVPPDDRVGERQHQPPGPPPVVERAPSSAVEQRLRTQPSFAVLRQTLDSIPPQQFSTMRRSARPCFTTALPIPGVRAPALCRRISRLRFHARTRRCAQRAIVTYPLLAHVFANPSTRRACSNLPFQMKPAPPFVGEGLVSRLPIPPFSGPRDSRSVPPRSTSSKKTSLKSYSPGHLRSGRHIGLAPASIGIAPSTRSLCCGGALGSVRTVRSPMSRRSRYDDHPVWPLTR